MAKKNKYKVQCQEIIVVNRTYNVTAQDENEVRKKVRSREWDEILADSLVSRSEPFNFNITPMEER